jgi:hypothetical protein
LDLTLSRDSVFVPSDFSKLFSPQEIANSKMPEKRTMGKTRKFFITLVLKEEFR